MSRSTVYGWREQWTINQAWRQRKTEGRRFHLRQFTDEQEVQMAEIILSEYIAAGRLFTSGMFRVVASQCWKDQKWVFLAKISDIKSWIADIGDSPQDESFELVVTCDETA
jgi:hypothetical protein